MIRQEVHRTEVHLLEPVGDGHHDVERAKKEDEMEEWVAVHGFLFLIVQNILSRAGFLLIIVIFKKTEKII